MKVGVVIDKSNLENLKLKERNYSEYKDYEQKYMNIRSEYEKRIAKDGMNIKCEKSRIKSEMARLNTPVINWVLSLIAVLVTSLLSLTTILISITFNNIVLTWVSYLFIGLSILIVLLFIYIIVGVFHNYIKMKNTSNSGFDDDIVFYNTCLCILEDLENGEERKELEKARQEAAVTLDNEANNNGFVIKFISKIVKALN